MRLRPISTLITALLLVLSACGGGASGSDVSTLPDVAADPGITIDVPDTKADATPDVAVDLAVDTAPDLTPDFAPDVCVPACEARTCGDDGCGGSCGTCSEFAGSFCTDAGACDCTADCAGRACGDDGCGGSCGACPPTRACDGEGQCVAIDCASDLDCTGSGLVCDPLTKTCVACLTAEDCGAGFFRCEALACVTYAPCESSLDCTLQVCDVLAGACVDCAADADCAGDAICRDQICLPITPCASSLECTDQVCNKDKGYCVDCIANADCGANADCTNDTCVSYTPCDSDLDCTPLGLLCDKSVGRCVQCLTNGECPDVYHCKANHCRLDVCVPGSGACDKAAAYTCLDDGSGWGTAEPCAAGTFCKKGECLPWVCTPGSVACVDNAVRTCDAFGATYEDADCGPTASCLVDACVPTICEPDVVECVDDFSTRTCITLGTAWGNPVPCPAGHYCAAGLCLAQVCSPESVECAGNAVRTCDAAGSAYADVDCGVAAVCLGGACAPKICEPSGLTCDGDFAWKQCNLTGTTWGAPSACEAGHYCAAGQCVAQVCTAGAATCDGNAARLCNAIGSGYASITDCGLSAACVNGACVPKVCEPSGLACDGDFSWKQCNLTGTAWGSPTACAVDRFCTGGLCLPQVCEPGTSYCKDGDTVETCNTIGSGPATSVPCAQNTTCLEGQCVPVICTPASHLCIGGRLGTCNASGTDYLLSDCGANQYCDAGTCKDRVCTPDALFCKSFAAWLCNAQGSSFSLVEDCASAGKLCVDGACKDKLCEPTTRFCDGATVKECDSTGTAASAVTTCGNGFFCDEDEGLGTAACAAWACTPNALFCDSTNVRQCDAVGSASVQVQACADTAQACVNGACSDVLACGGVVCPEMTGYTAACNAQQHCEYTNVDPTGWRQWDVWIWIPPGSFEMGSPDTEIGRNADEGPVHTVTFEYGYYIGKYEVTVTQHEACEAETRNGVKCTTPATNDWTGLGWGTNRSTNGRADHPQNGLTWAQAGSVCTWLGGRRPSEAEWEYAATGPTHRKYPWGDVEPTCANQVAVYDDVGNVTRPWSCDPCTTTGCSGTKPEGSVPAGASWSGAVDVAGNVWEWAEDWYHDSFTGAPMDGSAWSSPSGTYRIRKGGAFYVNAPLLRTAARSGDLPGNRTAHFGARCVRPDPAAPKAWTTALFEDFNDNLAQGWSTCHGCAAIGCPSVASGVYKAKGDWNYLCLPSVDLTVASVFAHEFTFHRTSKVDYWLVMPTSDTNTATVSFRADSSEIWFDDGPAKLVLAAPEIGDITDRTWRLEFDVPAQTCSVFVDGVLIGTKPFPAKAVLSKPEFRMAANQGTSLDAWVDNYKIEAR